jgi:hypothetical protein
MSAIFNPGARFRRMNLNYSHFAYQMYSKTSITS